VNQIHQSFPFALDYGRLIEQLSKRDTTVGPVDPGQSSDGSLLFRNDLFRFSKYEAGFPKWLSLAVFVHP
jgi:hypothetical protein